MEGGRTSLCQSRRPTCQLQPLIQLPNKAETVNSVPAHVHWSGRGEAQLGLESLVDDAVAGPCDEVRKLDGLGALVYDLRVSPGCSRFLYT